MSGWPWMNGETVAIADAVPDDNDSRPIVKDLVQEHRDLLDEMQTQLAKDESELFDRNKHDDLWCLRFLLSHKKNGERALAAAKTTLAFRNEHALDQEDIRTTPPQHFDKAVNNPALGRFMTSGVGKNSVVYEVIPSRNTGGDDGDDDDDNDATAAGKGGGGGSAAAGRGVVTYINIGNVDPHQLAELEISDWVSALTYANEWNYQWLDYLTRTSGRLTKSVRIVDVSTVQLGQIDLKCQEKYTTAIGGMQDCFPQAVQSIYICFAPGWIQFPWRVIRPFLPERVVEKMDFLNPIQEEDDLKRLLQHVSKESLPVHFGGTLAEWPRGSTSEEVESHGKQPEDAT